MPVGRCATRLRSNCSPRHCKHHYCLQPPVVAVAVRHPRASRHLQSVVFLRTPCQTSAPSSSSRSSSSASASASGLRPGMHLVRRDFGIGSWPREGATYGYRLAGWLVG
ncbi:hypothetical protein LIA77_04634 [Sarocladium implicatum]|nr:hypothetical protein LIA77_04634 [Sarocladium implicatum]